MSASVKTELCATPAPGPSARHAELATALRFAGGLRIVAGTVTIEAEVDTSEVAARLRRAIGELHGHVPHAQVISDGGRRGSRYVVRLVRGAEALAHQTGLLDGRGRPVRGLPPPVVAGNLACAEAVWRGAFLARGTLAEPGRAPVLEVACPGPEAALALAGAARRLGVRAKPGEARGVNRVVVRDGDAIGALLARMGAPRSAHGWTRRQHRRAGRVTATRLVAFDGANARRSAHAAALAAARARRALDILGEDLPANLQAAGRLRAEYPHASLEQLGQLAALPMSKDAIAGRVRRLLALADSRAAARAVPDTDHNPPPDPMWD